MDSCRAAPGPTSRPASAAGKYTVQSSVFTQKGADLSSWTVTYNLYD